jgi:hypothetical protein
MAINGGDMRQVGVGDAADEPTENDVLAKVIPNEPLATL